uniref:Peptidase M12B domain-containing protein n=1 Tax=Arion vulgaris TaxID=1028688 RepID=A0A0B7A7Y9_9EUPU
MSVAAKLCLFFVLLCQIYISIGLRTDAPFKLPCTSRRTEIVFPVISDVTGRVTSLDETLDFPSRDVIYVSLEWRRDKFNVVLYKNDLTVPNTHTEWSSGNETFAKFTKKSCFYHGYIKGQRSSYGALSTCNGLAGYIQTDEEMLFIQPATLDVANTSRAHIVYTCEPIHRVAEPEWDPPTEWPTDRLGRHRRSAEKPKYLEVMVVVDSNVVEEVGGKDKTEDYVMTLMNIANTVYQHHTLGVDIRVVVVKIIFLEKSQQKSVLKRLDAFRTVNLFCEWSKNQIPSGKPMHYDISVLITKEELGPSGYAPITGLCNPVRSCAAVRDEGFTTGFIIAHEMAHVFGLFHDGHGNDCHGRKYLTSMMAALVESKLNHFWWSDCSSKRMKEMVRYLPCINNEPKPLPDHFPLKAPAKLESKIGQPWSLEFQCRMEFGAYFKLCGAFYNDPCGTLWCSHSSQPHLCRTKRGPPLPGSQCGAERECRNEICQYVGDMRPVNGYWGRWSPWTECSTECGIGVRQRARICDNPAPAYDGKQCEGEDSQWDTCVNNTCSKFEDIRAGECAVWDSLQIRYGTHKWQPFEGQNASSLCQQTCRSFYTNEIVTIEVDASDGAQCSYTGNTSNICVEGKCLTVGCDGVMNSTKREDMCGVCGGNSSQCKTVQGNFVKKPSSGEVYILVVTIPAGARHIKIEETNRSSQFLALQNPRYATYNLNGDKRQSTDLKLVINGAMFEYKRDSVNSNEMITSPGPLRGNIQVMVYPNKLMNNTAVHFSYVVHKSDFTLEMTKYKWKFETWSTCSVPCGEGVQTIIHGCYDKDSDAKVDDESCSLLKPPRKDEVKCLREACGQTRYNFAMSSDYEECDAKCGQTGRQVQKFYCERLFVNNGTYSQVSSQYCEHIVKPNHTRKCSGKQCETQERFQWLAFDTWSECPCGGQGTETRKLYCEKVITATNGKEPDIVEKVDLEKCHDVPNKPESSRPCKGKACDPRFQWTDSGLYTPCSAACGETGKQEVIFECEQITMSDGVEFFEIADSFLCEDSPKPETQTNICTGEPCDEQSDKYEWQATEQWTNCSADCGKSGNQTRIYKCQKLGKKGTVKESNSELCEANKKGNEKRNCNGPECPLRWTVEKWSECSVTCGRGKHYRNVYCGDPKDDSDDYKCTNRPPATSKFCSKKDCPATVAIEPRDEDCSNKYLFCSTYTALEHRCKRVNFRRKCCRSCMNYDRSINALQGTLNLNSSMRR